MGTRVTLLRSLIHLVRKMKRPSKKYLERWASLGCGNAGHGVILCLQQDRCCPHWHETAPSQPASWENYFWFRLPGINLQIYFSELTASCPFPPRQPGLKRSIKKLGTKSWKGTKIRARRRWEDESFSSIMKISHIFKMMLILAQSPLGSD